MLRKSNKQVHQGYLVLFACCAICFSSVALSFNTVGIFYTPAGDDLGIETGRFGSYMAVQYLAMSISMIFAGKIISKISARMVITFCTIMVSVSLISMSTFSSLWQFYCAGAVIGVANSVLLYLMVPTMIDRWFSKRVGFFIGVALSFTGVGAIILNPIGGFVIDAYGWRMGYLVLGSISGIIGIPSAFFLIRTSPFSENMLPCGVEAQSDDASVNLTNMKIDGVSYHKALKSPALILVALHAGMMDLGITINYYIPSFVSSLGHPIILVSSVASAVMIGQLVGKMLLGFINDIDVHYGVLTAVTCGVVGIAIMIFFGKYGLWALYSGALLYGVFFAGATVTTSLMTRGVFGSLEFDRIFSIVAMVAALFSGFSSAVWGAIVDFTGSYYVMLGAGLVMMLSIYVVGYYALKVGAEERKRIEQEQANLEFK